jgi:hypothetical protein
VYSPGTAEERPFSQTHHLGHLITTPVPTHHRYQTRVLVLTPRVHRTLHVTSWNTSATSWCIFTSWYADTSFADTLSAWTTNLAYWPPPTGAGPFPTMATSTVPFPSGTRPTDIDGWTAYAMACLARAALPIFNFGTATAGVIATSTSLDDTQEYDRFKAITNLCANPHLYLQLEQTSQNAMTTIMTLPDICLQQNRGIG